MTTGRLIALLVAAALPVLAGSQAAAAGPGKAKGKAKHGESAARLVFVQTNESTGNRIAVYRVAADGHLDAAGTYATGGNGGTALPGTESDHLATQGSLVYVPERRVLIAVNAGSDTVSTFRVHGDALKLESVVPSGGDFPASVAVHHKIVYVLNAGGTGIVQGFRLAGHKLRPIAGSARSLGLANTDPPNFLTSPGQVGFTPDGRQLIVTTKASGSMIDVFSVGHGGMLSAAPVHNASATPVPFAFTFTPTGRLAVGEAGASSVTTYVLNGDGMLADPKSAPDGQVALCWILQVGQYYYVSNTGSNTLSAYTIGADGQPALVGPTGVVATTNMGPIDLASPSGTSFLYAQTGSGFVHEYVVNADGTLTSIGVVAGLPPGMEGIAAT
jgi:6-phosphogluconolactonase (cycloisomerase 2 family)